MDTDEDRLNAISQQIIGCSFRVHNVLGCGFAEKVYEHALAHELRKAGLNVESQARIEVHYDGVLVGEYFADLIVERLVLIELKAVRTFDDAHTAQCLNYLAATRIPLCLLLNFGRKVEIRRYRAPQK
jgi:GxxExxY protein